MSAEAWLDGYRSGLGMAALKADEVARHLSAIAEHPCVSSDDSLRSALRGDARGFTRLAAGLRTMSASAALEDVPKSVGDEGHQPGSESGSAWTLDGNTEVSDDD